MTPGDLEQRVAAARRFNRFYTRRIGVLREGAYRSPFSLTQVRVLYELAHRDRPTATELGRELGLDAGYLSRLLRGFEQRGLVVKTRSATDGRQTHLALTTRGRKAFAPLDARSHEEVAALLAGLSAGAQQRLLAAMRTIEELLGPRPREPASYALRPPRPGDLGWLVQRHGALYAREYGYDAEFEGLVADIVGRFARRHDPTRERCWIAEQDGENVGCVLLVAKSRTVAQLRVLLVEPAARGSGLGTRLVSECVRFARAAGYRKLVLWTQSELLAARRLYESAGFHRTHRERHASFGRKHLVAETWERRL
ncbi:MAG TPA: bifunctional helix-turn-helix transcriptional regulator/GNAT family N-acetyltransferase [Gemmatimonadales bacterium]|nr:bifunctional helix-turn-helix transcriptional regulator/GNAT family N-acetyltransferase [Gemmatimonadales bacterium]